MKESFEDPVGKPFVFPLALVSQISECAPEGFILFYIDQLGRPQVRAVFDRAVNEMGLRAYASRFLQGINMVEESNIADTIYEEGSGESEEESDNP